jgi:hypothetical protein
MFVSIYIFLCSANREKSMIGVLFIFAMQGWLVKAEKIRS